MPKFKGEPYTKVCANKFGQVQVTVPIDLARQGNLEAHQILFWGIEYPEALDGHPVVVGYPQPMEMPLREWFAKLEKEGFFDVESAEPTTNTLNQADGKESNTLGE